MLIRKANQKDEDKVANLIAHFRVELKKLKGIEANLNLAFAKEEFQEYIQANYPIFVAENEDNEVIGYLVCRIDNSVVWVESIYVSSDYRRSGIGSQLYQKAEALAQENGHDTVYNWIHPNNEKIINFLAKRGYNVLNLIEVRKAYKAEVLRQKIKIGEFEYDY